MTFYAEIAGRDSKYSCRGLSGKRISDVPGAEVSTLHRFMSSSAATHQSVDLKVAGPETPVLASVEGKGAGGRQLSDLNGRGF